MGNHEILKRLEAKHATYDDLHGLVKQTASEMVNNMDLEQQVEFLLDRGVDENVLLAQVHDKNQCSKCGQWIDSNAMAWKRDKWVCDRCEVGHHSYCNCANCGTRIPTVQTTRQHGQRVGQYCCKVVKITKQSED